MSNYVKIASTSDLPENGKLMLEVDDRLVVLVRLEGTYFCIDDVCTHDGGPLGEGDLCGHELACPRHGAKFDVRNGEALTMPATEPTIAHEVKVEGDDILVRLTEE